MKATNLIVAIACVILSWSPAFAVVNAPTALSGLKLWLDGNDVDGNGISAGAGETYTTTWVDKSGLSNNFTAPGAAPTRTLGGLGGKDIVTFNGSTQFFSGPSAILAANDDDYTYFAVFRSNTASGVHSVYEQNGPVGTGGARSALLQVNGAYGFNGESNDRHDLVPISAGSFHVTAMTVDNSQNPNNIKITDNGVSFAGTTGNPAALSVGTTSTNVGRKANNAEFMSGDIAELIVYDRVLSSTEQSDVNAYLASKWSVAVAPSGLDSLKHRWSFNDGTANDSIGTANGIPNGTGATIVGGRLSLDGANDFVQTTTLPETNINKTMVVWISPKNLTQQSGGVMTVEDGPGNTFDAVDFGERTAGQWMSGSDFFNRSPINNGGASESVVDPGEIMLAIAYGPGGRIDIYRNGVLYAGYNTGGPITYAGGNSNVLFGLRHLAAIGNTGSDIGNDAYWAGFINEARLYGDVLSASQIQTLFNLGPNQLAVGVPEPTSLSLLTLAGFALLRRKRVTA